MWLSMWAELPRPGKLRGDYLFFKETIMDTTTQKRNFKLYGELHPNSKLTRVQVIEIRNEAKVPGTSRAWLAKRYGVSRTTIDNEWRVARAWFHAELSRDDDER